MIQDVGINFTPYDRAMFSFFDAKFRSYITITLGVRQYEAACRLRGPASAGKEKAGTLYGSWFIPLAEERVPYLSALEVSSQ